MNKSQILKELRGLWNGTRMINGVKVARCNWKNYPYMIIENDETFDDCKKDDFIPIKYFETSIDLANAIKTK